MGLLSLKCPSCGANLNVKEGRDDYFCQYCGAKLEYAKQRIELSGTVNVSGMANEATLLERAFLYAEDSNFNDAKVYFNKVLDINPRNAKAYMGLLICKLGIRTIDDLQNYDYPISQHEEYQKAVRFAGLKEKQQYDSLNTSLLERYISMMSSRRAEIEELNNKIISDKKIGNDNRINISRLKAKETILLTILIIIIILDLLSVTGIILEPPFAIIFLVILGNSCIFCH